MGTRLIHRHPVVAEVTPVDEGFPKLESDVIVEARSVEKRYDTGEVRCTRFVE